ncbi:MAG: peptidase, partial [Candidatus Latescibacterota bacterium]
VDWYYQVTLDHGNWEDMPPKSPPYWGKYTFHDNNRDGIQLSQPLSKNLARIFFRYHPQVMHDLHESVPLLYISSGTGPYNEALDPIVTSEWQLLSNYEVMELTKFGMPGVWTWGFYTGWYPGYLMWFANNHNSIGRFYETFGNAGASTFERKLEQSFAKKKVTDKEWYRPLPPNKKVKWTFRNNINYMETGVLIALDYAAQNGKSLLFNFWQKGQNAIDRGQTEAPYSWIIPKDNQNKFELAYLINNLLRQGIEVHTADEPVTVDEDIYPAGCYLVRMDQPYGDLARSLLEYQRFPKDAEYRPYDDVAWTLPLLYGVVARPINDLAILDAPMSLVEVPVHLPGAYPQKRGACYIVPVSSSQTLLQARHLLHEFDVFAADTSFSVGNKQYAMGSWIIPAEESGDDLYNLIARAADSLSIDIHACRSVPDVPLHLLDIPRIAVFHTWMYTQDSGWVRYTFDNAGIPYDLINKDDLRQGDLHGRYDVILIPNLGGFFKPKHLVHGIDSKWGPLPYMETDRFPNLGRIDRTHDITGGMGFTGLANLESFLDDGGTLITFAGGSLIPVELGLVRHIDHESPEDFFNPGSVVRAMVTDPSSPIICGYDSLTAVFRGSGPLFTVSKNYRHFTVLQYGTKIYDDDEAEENDSPDDGYGEHAALAAKGNKTDSICLSGLIKGEKHLDGQPAILDVPKGGGRVIIFTFNPLHRFMTHANFALAYNAILHWNDRGRLQNNRGAD